MGNISIYRSWFISIFDEMKDILIAGIAWSGKWTQARALEKRLGDNMQYFEPWSILRAFTSNDNIVWDYAKMFTSAGKLLPDAFMKSVLGLVFASLHEGNRLLIDGFPRLYAQKKMFDDVMQENGRDFIIFHLDLAEEVAQDRLLHRKICSACGTTYSTTLDPGIEVCKEDGTALSTRVDDQSIDVIQERFSLYRNETKPILSEYDLAGKVVHIDGTKSIDEITNIIMEHI